MKTIITFIAALVCVASTQAQVIRSYNFEENSYKGWLVWQNKKNIIVGEKMAKDSKHALRVMVGTSFDAKALSPKTSYLLSADVRAMEVGKPGGEYRIDVFDSKIKKMVTVHKGRLPNSTEYTRFKTKFRTKAEGMYRIIFWPNADGYTHFILDNVQLEKK